MGIFGVFLFGAEDEVKVKEFQKIFDIKDYEKAKDLYCQVKNILANKED